MFDFYTFLRILIFRICIHNYTYMGAQNKSAQKQNQGQKQVIEQNYANNIMLLAFSTLESITRRIMRKDGNSEKKRYGKQDKVDFSSKTMQELVSQFKTHLFLFRVSKEDIQKQFKEGSGFIFPKDFSKQTALKEVATFRVICQRANDQTILSFCDDFRKIIEGNYSNLSFQTANVKVEYSQKEKQKQRGNLLKIGLNASQKMNELREQVQRAGIMNPAELKANIKNSDVQYEKEASFKPAQKK